MYYIIYNGQVGCQQDVNYRSCDVLVVINRLISLEWSKDYILRLSDLYLSSLNLVLSFGEHTFSCLTYKVECLFNISYGSQTIAVKVDFSQKVFCSKIIECIILTNQIEICCPLEQAIYSNLSAHSRFFVARLINSTGCLKLL